MPAPGLWGFTSELNGTPGRGFQLEVENEVLVLSYYGYRADGSSVFYSASGPITNNRFEAPLTEYRGGTVLGGAYQPAAVAASPGNVVLTFSSGKNGSIQLPGSPALAITKFSFGYAPTPQGLLGTYLLTYASNSLLNADLVTLSKVPGFNSSTGSGFATSASGTFGCENQTSGVLAGGIVCTEATNSDYDDAYLFKMSGDDGAGVGTYRVSSLYYLAVVRRVATQTGNATGINDSSPASLTQYALPIGDSVVGNHAFDSVKQQEAYGTRSAPLAQDEREALQRWAAEARNVLGANQAR